MLFVVGIMGVVSAFSLPLFERTVESFRLTGTARSVANAMALAKIRAASSFTRVRLYVDRSSGTHHLERLDKSVTPAHWTTDGITTSLPNGVSFGYSPVATPPTDTQPAIDQAPNCTQDDNVTAIGNTSCIVFNSRGVPVDPVTGVPINTGALYLTDGLAVFGVTVAPTGMIKLWRTSRVTTPAWVAQ